jgi:hypothetical protein
VIALIRRRIEIALLALIPVGSAFLAGAYDFRILLAAPIWVLAMAYAVDAVRLGRGSIERRPGVIAANVVVLAIVAAGLLPSAVYLWNVSRDSRAQYLLPHRDVAVSRLMQDVVAGSAAPTSEMKADEFNRVVGVSTAEFDHLACAERAYAVAHLYLQPFDDRRILSFCDGGNQALIGEDGVLEANVRALAAPELGRRGLKLIWEESEIAQPTIARFAQLERFGSSQRLAGTVDGQTFAIRVLTIPADNVDGFRQAVADANPGVLP